MTAMSTGSERISRSGETSSRSNFLSTATITKPLLEASGALSGHF
jgi:hypothetical protein